MQDGNEPARRRLRWAVRLALGLLVFWIAFHDIDLPAVRRAFALIRPAWLGAACGSVFLTVALVVTRWRLLLGSATRVRHAPVLFAAVIASQVANIVMPFRLGDAVRIGAVARALNLPPAEILGSVAIERLLDVVSVALTAAILMFAGALPAAAHAGMTAVVAGAALAIAFLVLVRLFHGRLQRLAAGPVRLVPERVRRGVSAQIALAIRGFQTASAAGTGRRAFIASCGVMAGSIFTAWLVMRAFDLAVPAVAAAVLVVVLQIGTAVVPIPGAVGISQVLTVQTLKLWGVDEATALAYALMLYLVSRVPKLAVLPFALSSLTPKTAEPA